MGLKRQEQSNAVFLAAKHFCLWQEIKKHAEGCDAVEVTNPETKEVLTKYGFRYKTVEGRATKLEEYNREHAGKRYIGFKLHLQDGPDGFVIDMPYDSRFLRSFLKIAPNVNWDKPLSISVFKGKSKDGKDEQAIWMQQGGETLKFAFTKDHPGGMPQPTQNQRTQKWDFTEQHEWLIEKMLTETAPAIETAAKRFAPPATSQEEPEPDHSDEGEPFAPVEDELPRILEVMPHTAQSASGDPQLKAWLDRAALNPGNATKVINEICDKCYEVSNEFAQEAWAAANRGRGSSQDTIRSLYQSLAEKGSL